MKNIIGNFTIILLLLCMFVGCSDDPKFKVNGTIAGSEGEMLYFEAMEINNIALVDSVKLKSNGNFNFMAKRPASPEFYRLRIKNKIINFSVDSTETITIDAPYNKFSTDYTIKGSDNNEKIKELTLLQLQLQHKVDSLMKAANGRYRVNLALEENITTAINDYKQLVKKNYIFTAPNKAYSYFALFQQLNNYMIFDPYNNKDDVKAFAAVATSYHQSYPHTDRARNLYNITIKGMKNTRSPQQNETNIPVIQEAGIIDIELNDRDGNIHKLSNLEGKIVILDFTVYQSAVSVAHNFALRELYDKYNSRGLEIYQVSLDADEHFWITTTANLPWICVRDPRGIYSTFASIYNVQEVPTYFLINKNSELNSRDENIKNLENEIKKLL